LAWTGKRDKKRHFPLIMTNRRIHMAQRRRKKASLIAHVGHTLRKREEKKRKPASVELSHASVGWYVLQRKINQNFKTTQQ